MKPDIEDLRSDSFPTPWKIIKKEQSLRIIDAHGKEVCRRVIAWDYAKETIEQYRANLELIIESVNSIAELEQKARH